MELSEALKNGNQKDVDFLKREIEQSNNEGVVRAMNQLFKSEEIAEATVRSKIQGISEVIVEKEEYDIGKGLLEVYSRLPLYYQDEFIMSRLKSKLLGYQKKQKLQEESRSKAESKKKKKPFWQKAVIKVMGKLGYGSKEQTFAHKKIEEGTVFEHREKAETVFSSDDQN